MKRVYAPGCALTIYKPHLAGKLHRVLSEKLWDVERSDTCCRNHPEFPDARARATARATNQNPKFTPVLPGEP